MDRPQWLTEYCTMVREALHLQAWEITYVMSDRPIEDRPECGAACRVQYPYWKACLEFRPSDFMEPSIVGKQAVIHEHLHISLAELTHAIETAVNAHVKPKHRGGILNHIYSDAEERCITRLERAIYDMLEPKGADDQARGAAD